MILSGAWLGAAGGLAQITPVCPEIPATTTSSSAYQGAPAVVWHAVGDYGQDGSGAAVLGQQFNALEQPHGPAGTVHFLIDVNGYFQ
jgi:hypothetical protein